MNTKFTKLLASVSAMLFSLAALGQRIYWYDGNKPVSYHVDGKTDIVVGTALKMFSQDMAAVTGKTAVTGNEKNAAIRIIELDRASSADIKKLKRKGVPTDKLLRGNDGFHIAIVDKHITVVGSNGRGTAYGILELSRMAGVNPWIWWGDITPEKKTSLTIDASFTTTQQASVEYRGVFINDEDWSTRPWSGLTFDKLGRQDIGPATYKKICQLLLRLRGNALWPGMHPGTTAFFKIPTAKAIADSCGIVVGSSHCEPLLRNNVGEWDTKKRGAFNYITNRNAVQDYWIERLKEVKGSAGGNMFTIGMRGIHDGSMEGVKTMEEKTTALQQVINDQQDLIRKYIGDPAKQMQVFVPYKEVLDIYNRGLKVPDYATLMWCDDNYGYLTRLSNAEEQKRSGGGGVYYHLSYWGRPHDYLWLTTTQPGLIASEMKNAYDHNVRKLWIANVHDPKVAGYDLELFLDMAWDINSVSLNDVGAHYRQSLCRQFGSEAGNSIYPSMRTFFRLCGERKPEFMGWCQTELDKKKFNRGISPVIDTEFSADAFGNELERYLDQYAEIAANVHKSARLVQPELRDAYFAAILYPVDCAASMAHKLLYAQKARAWTKTLGADADSTTLRKDTTLTMLCARSLAAYRNIAELTRHYNSHMSDGKWNGLMHMAPRDLPVFGRPDLPINISRDDITRLSRMDQPQPKHPLRSDRAVAHNACEWQQASAGAQVVDMLGHSMRAVALPQGDTLTYRFSIDADTTALLRIALIPTQPNDNGDLRFSVSVDGGKPTVFNLKEPFRSEQWKLNVMRGQALRTLPMKQLKKGVHTLTIKALDPHIIIDQWMVDFNPQRKFYLFPVE